MNVEIVLREAGFTDSERKVYLALLDLGESTRSAVVDRSGIAGSKIYEVLERLQQKGLVSVYVKNKTKHFRPTNPSQILRYLESRREEIVETEKSAKSILPELLAKYASSKESQEVELVSGISGLQMLFMEQIDILNSGDTCYVIGGTRGIEEGAVHAFFHKIHVLREQKKIKTRMLFNLNQKESWASNFASPKYRGTSIRYIEHASPVALNIYKDRTVIILFGKDISAIHIRSKDVASSFLEYFELLWRTAKQ